MTDLLTSNLTEKTLDKHTYLADSRYRRIIKILESCSVWAQVQILFMGYFSRAEYRFGGGGIRT